MTTSDHVYILTTIDSDGDTWIVNVCDTLDAAQRSRVLMAKQLVLDGHAEDVEDAIFRRQLRIAYYRVEDRAAVEKAYSPK